MWSSLPGGESPTTRGKHSATMVGRCLYVLGGRSGNVPLRDLWRFHVEKNFWERVKSSGDTPPCLQEHTAVARGDKLYVFGGEVAINITEVPLWVLDTTNHRWRKLSGGMPAKARTHGTQASPRGRRGHTAHCLGDTMLIYGGYQDLKGSTNEIWAYHFEREIWQLLNACGPSRHRHAATLYDRKLYVHGGMSDLTERGDTHVFDIMNRKWRTIRSGKVSPGSLSGAACARVGARMVLVGGESDGQLTDAMWSFHYSTETWERIWSGHGGPAPRVDGVALAIPRDAFPSRDTVPTQTHRLDNGVPQDENLPSFLQEIGSNLARLTARPRTKAARCSYTALTPDSNESIPSVPLSTIIKSRSIHGGVARDLSPKEGDVAAKQDSHLPLTKLVHLDSDEEDYRKDSNSTFPKSASVRFSTLQASEQNKKEYTNPTELGFANPNYMTASEAARQLSTPDSGVESGSGAQVEMRDMRTSEVKTRKSHIEVLLLIGGRERPHAVHLGRPLAMWCRDV